MSRVVPLLVLLAACTSDPGNTGDTDTGVAVRTWVEGSPESGIAVLVVQVRAPSGQDVALPEPEVGGLTFTEAGQPVQERIGDDQVSTRRFRFTGEPGSYEIPSLQAGAGDASAPLWVDLGQPAAPLDGFADIVDPEPTFRLTPALLVGGACVGLTGLGALGGVALAFGVLGRSRRARVLPPEPPDVAALRRWEAVLGDSDLSDHDKAVALGVLFRDYIEAVLGFPATAWTTSEIVDHLEGMAHLAEGNPSRARRILRATDRIKFADAAARETLFQELDDALRAFVGTTRPRGWEADA